MTDHPDWDTLAKKAEAGQLQPLPGATLRGEDAAAANHGDLMTATGTDTIEDATRVALGRPRLNAPEHDTVTWKVRAPGRLDHIVEELARREGKTRSALIRDAVAEYARTHRSA